MYNEQEMFRTLVRENLGSEFANSFLVAASKEELTDPKVSYASVSDERKNDFATITTIEGDSEKRVRKTPLYEDNSKHLKNMVDYFNNVDDPDFAYCGAKVDGNSVLFDFVEGNSFEKSLVELIKKGKTDELKKGLNFLKNHLYANSEISPDYLSDQFKEVF